MDAFLKLNDNFSGIDATGGVPMVNGRNFSQDAAARGAALNPYGLPTYSAATAAEGLYARNGMDVQDDLYVARNGPGVASTRLNVGSGDTLEGRARQFYGDNWLAGMAVMSSVNQLRTNQWGSPLIRAGGTLLAPSLDGVNSDQLGLLAAVGGSIESKNAAGLNRRAELIEEATRRSAQSATTANAGGYVDYRDPRDFQGSFGYRSLVSRQLSEASASAAETSPSNFDGVYDEYGLMTNPAAAPIGQVVAGTMLGGARVLAEPLAQLGDLMQAANEWGRSVATGDAPRDINHLSMLGQSAAQGATTTQVVNGGMYSLLKTPDRIIENFGKGDYYAAGEDIGGLSVGAGLTAWGARGTLSNVAPGLRLAAEDAWTATRNAAETMAENAAAPRRPNYSQRGSTTVDFLTLGLLSDDISAAGGGFVKEAPYVIRYDPRSPGRPDPRYSADSLVFNDPIGYNAKGFPRDAGEFWKIWIEQNPKSISPGNRYLIENYDRMKVSPRIDQTWIDAFPEHGNYKGDTLVHHHVDHGQYVIPVPGKTHVGSGGPWHK